MGYTHYLKTKEKTKFTHKKWKDFCKDVTLIIALARLEGIVIEDFTVTDDCLHFDCAKDELGESCVINKSNNKFVFCKTNTMDYDPVVVAVYLLVKDYLGKGCALSSDGSTGPGPGPNVIPNDFADGEDLVFRALGKKLTWPKD